MQGPETTGIVLACGQVWAAVTLNKQPPNAVSDHTASSLLHWPISILGLWYQRCMLFHALVLFIYVLTPPE